MEDQPAYGIEPGGLPGTDEQVRTWLPALHLLTQLGWKYLTPEQVNRLRSERLGRTILEPVLMNHLRTHCRFTFKGATHLFTENAIQTAVQALNAFRASGAVQQNEQAYDLLCLGTSVPQSIAGDTKSFTIDYIDWKNPANNAYHCTAAFKVARTGHRAYCTADIVLFVNGIPLVVMACKGAPRPHTRTSPIDDVIKKMGDLQAKDGIPQLFLFPQLLLALAGDKARYGTTGTPPLHWSVWKEAGIHGALRRIWGSPVDPDVMDTLLSGPFIHVRNTYLFQIRQGRQMCEQDRLVYALCRPERLLKLVYNFILFDGGTKKIARYQQYFTIEDILRRALRSGKGLQRPGGVVWHTQGSGKSLTMVMLAKALVCHPDLINPKVVLVTDRIDLDDQICGTFRACGVVPNQAKTGKHLVGLLKDRRAQVVTALVHKFAVAAAHRDLKQVDRNTFILVDEGHRSQYGRQHARMRISLEGACFIAFTGTPLAKSRKKNTFAQFGDLFRPAYTISRAVSDKAVVPLLYESRHIPQQVEMPAVDQWFDTLSMGLDPAQKADLKLKFSTEHRLNRALGKVRMIAWDIGLHYTSTYQHTGLKGQLVAPDKETALRYKSFMDGFGKVSSEVLVSSPSVVEGEDRQGNPPSQVTMFWQTMLGRYGTERNYNRQIINAFKHSESPEIIIVVDKLLTGFDAPRNTVLYLARKLRGHALLQAIARVNRLCAGKEYGLIMDYRGVIQDLDEAMDFYGQLAQYDPDDLNGTVSDVQAHTEQLAKKHAELWELLAGGRWGNDLERYEILLRDASIRNRFYDGFNRYARTLALSLSSTTFLREADEEVLRQYKSDLGFFQNLRAALGMRYQEVVDMSEYESRIKKVIDTHVGIGQVIQLSKPINILDAGQRAGLLADESKSVGAKVDMLAASTRYVIELEMAKDPAFYKKYSSLLKETIDGHHAGRLKALVALEKVEDIATKVTTHTDDDIPLELVGRDMARRYYGCVCETLFTYGTVDIAATAKISIKIDERLEPYKICDWRSNPDVINKMRGEIDDILFDATEVAGIDLSLEDHDTIIDRCIDVTIVNNETTSNKTILI